MRRDYQCGSFFDDAEARWQLKKGLIAANSPAAGRSGLRARAEPMDERGSPGRVWKLHRITPNIPVDGPLAAAVPIPDG